jgi:superoxide reductase
MNGLICGTCNYAALGEEAPEKCPVCGSPKTVFVLKENVLKTAADEADKVEKHSPVIVVNKQCGLIEGCVDVHVKVGEVLHPMEKEHFIVFIDCYLNNEFVSRVHLTPGSLNPAAGLHLKESSGNFTAIEFCNLHGHWITEKEL